MSLWDQVSEALVESDWTIPESVEERNGETLLHLAAKKGFRKLCFSLMEITKIPWNVLDINGKSVGEVALEHGHVELYKELVMNGVRTEFVLQLLGQRVIEDGDLVMALDSNGEPLGDWDANGDVMDGGLVTVDANGNGNLVTVDAMEAATLVSNSEYLKRPLHYSKDGSQLLDSEKNAVMMGWERPLMELHCKVIAPTKGKRVLNVGFGLGIIDTMLQNQEPTLHTIIEAHPDVYKKMIDDGWDKKPNVEILFGRWQDVVDKLQVYDGIFFDTFGEYYDDLRQFHEILPNILDEGGIYSFFNGLAGTNSFFHDVSCEIAKLDLEEMGFRVQYDEVLVDKLGDDVWRDTKRAYWSLDIYRVPTVTFDL